MEQRRTRRFQLELPLSITRAGSARVALTGKTKNISSTGVLFTADGGSSLAAGAIEYVIALSRDGAPPVNIRCLGKILRASPTVSPEEEEQAYEIAATLERYEFVRDRRQAAS